jgi:hypothetical protein
VVESLWMRLPGTLGGGVNGHENLRCSDGPWLDSFEEGL